MPKRCWRVTSSWNLSRFVKWTAKCLANHFSMSALSNLIFCFALQTNRMTSWIDASFVYSTNEAWVNAMRTFVGGSLKMEGDSIFGMPSRNVDRVPLANHPAPHVLRMLDPERMYCKYWNTNLPISPLLVINECNSSQNCKLISKK